MKRERACKGCDGSGYVHRPDFFSDMPHTGHAATCWCGATDCPACLGTGRVVDHIPVADAVADAETLHTYAWDGGAEVGDLTPAYLDAAAVDLREDELLDDFAAPIAESAARAAFRAVPGLRG